MSAFNFALALIGLAFPKPTVWASEINIGLLVPYTGWEIGSRMASGAITALDTIQDAGLLTGYDIRFDIKDDACDKRIGVDIALQQWQGLKEDNKELHGFIGSACSSVCEHVALIASSIGIPFVSFGCNSGSLANKINYPTFTSVLAPVTSLAPMYPRIMDKYNWTRVALLVDMSESIMTGLAQEIKRLVDAEEGKIAFYHAMDPISPWYGTDIEADKKEGVRGVLRNIFLEARSKPNLSFFTSVKSGQYVMYCSCIANIVKLMMFIISLWFFTGI